MKTIYSFFRLLLIGLLLVVGSSSTRAEVFELVHGGTILGELLNPNQSPRTTYLIRPSIGGELVLDRALVKKVTKRSSAEQEYEILVRQAADTSESQWELAEWCRKHQLGPQRQRHLKRILELDSNHRKARVALGYSNYRGHWVTQEDLMKQRGFERYQGRWHTTQEIALLERREKSKEVERNWNLRIKRIVAQLGGSNHDRAEAELLSIRDPAAVEPLARVLEKDRRREMQALYARALAQIGDLQAVLTLAAAAVEDEDREVRMECLDQLKKTKRPEVTAYFAARLRDKENQIVNRAAFALKELKDPRSVGPLIEALITTHKFKSQKGKPGQTSAAFGSDGPGGLAMGSSTKVYTVPFENPAVLDALLDLTSVNFLYDVPAWRDWYESKKVRPKFDARRIE